MGLTALLLASVATASAPGSANLVLEGRGLVQTHCATCHATGRTGKSPNRIAPRFRELGRRYDVETLSESFAEGVFVGHPDMPAFELSPREIDGLIAYLKSIQITPARVPNAAQPRRR